MVRELLRVAAESTRELAVELAGQENLSEVDFQGFLHQAQRMIRSVVYEVSFPRSDSNDIC